jgi:hypothetical protein
MPIPAFYAQPEEASLTPEAASVRRLYRLIAADLADGTTAAPTFETACALHALLDQIRDDAGREHAI